MNNKQLDPRTKIILLLIVSIGTFAYVPSLIIGAYVFIAFILLLLFKEQKKLFIYLLFFVAFKIILSFVPISQLVILKPFFIVISIFVGYFPLFIFVYYLISTTTVSEYSLALEKMKIPLGFQIALLVMFRFFPTVKIEAKSISNAMKLRGLNFTPISFLKHPIKSVEYLYVPLVYSLIKTGDELTIASLTRGLGLYKDRTYLCKIGFHFIDIFITLLFLVLLIIGFLYRDGIIC